MQLVPAPVEADEAHEPVAAAMARARGLGSHQVACAGTGFDEIMEAIATDDFPADYFILLVGFRCAWGVGSWRGCLDTLATPCTAPCARPSLCPLLPPDTCPSRLPAFPPCTRPAALCRGRLFYLPTLRRKWLEGPLRALGPSAGSGARLQRLALTLTGTSTDKGFGLYRRSFGSVVELLADPTLAGLSDVSLFRQVGGWRTVEVQLPRPAACAYFLCSAHVSRTPASDHTPSATPPAGAGAGGGSLGLRRAGRQAGGRRQPHRHLQQHP